MTYDPEKHHRRSIRLKGYDYTSVGIYFVTICTQHRACLFGDINGVVLQLNDAGRMVQSVWLALPRRFPTIQLDEFVIMPNHFHGIVRIGKDCANNDSIDGESRSLDSSPSKSLGNIIGAFKSITTHQYILGVKQNHWQPFTQRLWQRNYYEYIIRNETAWGKIRHYIQTNPQSWLQDQLHPEHLVK